MAHIRTQRRRFIIQATFGTDLSIIKPKLPNKSTLVPLKHQMAFGGRTYRYFVPNDGFEYFLFKSNQTKGIRACTLEEKLENEELVVKDVLDFGEKVISEKSDKRRKKQLQEEVSEFVVSEKISHKAELKEKDQKVARNVFDFGQEEEVFHKMLKQELQEKDKEIAVLTKEFRVISQKNETLHKTLLQNLEKQVRQARQEHQKNFEEKFSNIREDQEVTQD